MWPENERAVGLFGALATQWRVAVGMAGAWWQGLDYAAIEPTCRLIGIEPDADLFHALRHCESAALEVLNGR